jgi:large subunit ribosomal protein L2
MPIRHCKPTTPGRRQMTINTFEQITTDKPHKALTTCFKERAGRNSSGRITVRHRGGGHKRRYRMLDFRFTDKLNIPAKVETIEYDPFRTAFIALVCYADGARRYVLAHSTMKVGDSIITTELGKPTIGHRMQIGSIPTGLQIHNLESIVGQ